MFELFFSYCHKDEDLRNEMEVHLTMLKRQGIISTWHDRRIGAGSEIDGSISEKLESAKIILLLVSPHFLASDYCYDREMTRAMERHESGEAIVIPVILRPCEWHGAPFGKLLATPTDGKPVTKYADQDDAFLTVVQDIRSAVSKLKPAHKPAAVAQTVSPVAADHQPLPRSSNLRIKRSFTDHEKDDFLESSFEYIARFFDGSLTELKERNGYIEIKFRRTDGDRFSASIYSDGQRSSQCAVWLERKGHLGNGIYYSTSESRLGNSFNECLSVSDDGYMLHLRTLGMGLSTGKTDKFSQEGAAEYFWGMLIQGLQH